ncbi:hypothetical protein ACFTQL_23005 [Peribacillus butanolivorans]|uniref:hypothetical protein n=1 Tax=Peribacillus butanolivorans TaxID=421767 RepID=UPI00362F8498
MNSIFLESGEVTSLTMQSENSKFKITEKHKGYDENKNLVTYVSGDAVDKLDKGIITVNPRKKTSGWVTFFTSFIPLVIIFSACHSLYLLVAVRKKWSR